MIALEIRKHQKMKRGESRGLAGRSKVGGGQRSCGELFVDGNKLNVLVTIVIAIIIMIEAG